MDGSDLFGAQSAAEDLGLIDEAAEESLALPTRQPPYKHPDYWSQVYRNKPASLPVLRRYNSLSWLPSNVPATWCQVIIGEQASGKAHASGVIDTAVAITEIDSIVRSDLRHPTPTMAGAMAFINDNLVFTVYSLP